MLKKLLHHIVANPRIYDQVQVLAGSYYVHNRIAAQIVSLNAASLVLELGGVAGIIRGLLPTFRTD